RQRLERRSVGEHGKRNRDERLQRKQRKLKQHLGEQEPGHRDRAVWGCRARQQPLSGRRRRAREPECLRERQRRKREQLECVLGRRYKWERRREGGLEYFRKRFEYWGYSDIGLLKRRVAGLSYQQLIGPRREHKSEPAGQC